jgi:hypothetical protein
LVVPAPTPVSTPVDVLIEAIEELVLCQVPPVAALPNVVVAAGQTLSVPVIVPGVAATVAVTVLLQPLASAYVIVALPKATPVTTPDVPTVATPVLLLLHVPPEVASLSVADNPTHILGVPVIAAIGETVATVVLLHTPALYVMVAVPALTAVSTPVVEPIVATEVLLLDQAPPLVALLSDEVLPAQSSVVPAIAAGAALTLATVVT